MGSGSIIHAMEHGAHHTDDHHTDPQDMRNMGGLRHKMRTTFYAYLFGTLALVGIFPFAGFWSKDEILAEAFLHGFGEHAENLSFWVYVAGAVGAIFTAYYMGRQIGMVFGGKPRTEIAEHAVQPGWRMTMPLVVLAFFSLVIGWVNIPDGFLFSTGWYHGFAGEVHLLSEEAAEAIEFAVIQFNWTVAISSTLLGLLFFALGWWRYSRYHSADAKDPIQLWPVIGRPLFAIWYNKYYFDEIYRGLFIYPTVWLADISAKFDYDWVINPIVNFVGWITRTVADGTAAFDEDAIDGYFVNGIPGLFNWFGGELRLLQTGRAQNYLLILVIGLLLLIGMVAAIFLGQEVTVSELTSLL
jgi:NADH-quinone oxidoreductase subunit L